MATAVTANLPHCTHRYVLFASYLGSKYHGLQRQVERDSWGQQDTVQEALEWSLRDSFIESKCRLTFSSRTDSGVHALVNCFSLPLMDFSKTTEQVMRSANNRLRDNQHDIVIRDVILTQSDFHPRKNATSREYIYKIAVLNDWKLLKQGKRTFGKHMLHLVPTTDLYRVTPVPYLDCDKALAVVDLFRGEHDFSSFATTLQEDSVRNLEFSLSEIDSNKCSTSDFKFYQFQLKSRSFLHNQVRRIIGALLSYASYDKLELDDIKRLLDSPSPANDSLSYKIRASMSPAEPWGLYLAKVNFKKSSFEDAIRTYVDGSKEEVIDLPCSLEESENEVQTEHEIIADG